METTSFFPGLIALLIAALLGFVAAWIWRSKRLTAAEKQAAKLRRERREMTGKMAQASRKFDALSKQRTKAVDALSTLKQQHQALETGHARLAASYANLKQSQKANETTQAQEDTNPVENSENEWFDGLDSSPADDSATQQKRAALKELEAFEDQLSSVSGELVRDNPSAVLERPAPDASSRTDEHAVVTGSSKQNGDTDSLRAQVAEQEAEIQRLREQMAPLLGLPLAVSTREAERDRLADVLKNKEQEILEKEQQVAGKDQALADKEQEIARKQQEIAHKQQEVQSVQEAIQGKQNEVRSKEKTIEAKEQEISELNAALRQRSEREATLNRELETAKRAEDTHLEEIRRLQADKDRDLLAAQQALAAAKRESESAQAMASEDKESEKNADRTNDKKMGNLGREVKDSSAVSAQPEANGVLPEKPTRQERVGVAGVQAAPLGSTVAIEDASANDSVPHVVRKSASVAAVDRRDDRSPKRGATKKEKPAPRQFERAPSRVDNLKEIKGIGPVLERMLNRVGVYQFRQIASWSDEDIDYFDTQLADFRGRIRRDDWPSGASAAYNRKYD